MKHAYLIIAHSDPVMLQILVSELDRPYADIFVHWDKKSGELPGLHSEHSDIKFVPDRVDVRWGDSSQMLCEFRLLETAAANGQYDYYHIISGSHYPFKSVEDYFSDAPVAVFSPMATSEDEINLKVRRISLFTRTFKSKCLPVELISQKLWTGVHKLQKIFRVKRYKGDRFVKASNWCSLSNEAVTYLLDREYSILKKYSHTFCIDEFFIPSELAATDMADRIRWADDYLYVDFDGSPNPRYLGKEDVSDIKASACLWARKFRSSDIVPDSFL